MKKIFSKIAEIITEVFGTFIAAVITAVSMTTSAVLLIIMIAVVLPILSLFYAVQWDEAPTAVFLDLLGAMFSGIKDAFEILEDEFKS